MERRNESGRVGIGLDWTGSQHWSLERMICRLLMLEEVMAGYYMYGGWWIPISRNSAGGRRMG